MGRAGTVGGALAGVGVGFPSARSSAARPVQGYSGVMQHDFETVGIGNRRVADRLIPVQERDDRISALDRTEIGLLWTLAAETLEQ